MEELLKKLMKSKLIAAIASIILGVVLIVFQGNAVAQLIRIIGWVLLICAVVNLVEYFRDGHENSAILASAILEIIFGFIFVKAPHWLVALFPVVMGLILAINSIFNLSAYFSSSFKTRRARTSAWTAILTLILGIIAIMHPSAMADVIIAFIGATFLINGISDLFILSLLK